MKNLRLPHLPVAALAILLAAPALAISPEIWVIAEGSSEILIVDDLADTPATIESVPLPSPAGEAPYGIAFATLADQPGAFAFVTQGSRLIVFDVAGRAPIFELDVAMFAGFDSVQLRGLAAGLPEPFAPGPDLVSTLHVAANVRGAPGVPLEPWYFVFDQAVLVGLNPVGTLLLSEGPLPFPQNPPPQGALDAMEVAVSGIERGRDLQRAWYTVREVGTPRLVVAEIGAEPNGAFVPRSLFEAPAGAGAAIPSSVHPATPHSTEATIVPLPGENRFVDLNSGRGCPSAQLPRASVITGPGFSTYSIWSTLIDPGGPDRVQLSDLQSCEVAPPVAVGENPVALETRGRIYWEELYVANRDSDTLSIVFESNPTVAETIPLDTVVGPSCDKCPRSLAVVERPETVCRAIELEPEFVRPDEFIHRFERRGCLPGVGISLWCRCLEADDADCPQDCPKVDSGAARGDGDAFSEVDVADPDNEMLTRDGTGASTETQTQPKDGGPPPP